MKTLGSLLGSLSGSLWGLNQYKSGVRFNDFKLCNIMESNKLNDGSSMVGLLKMARHFYIHPPSPFFLPILSDAVFLNLNPCEETIFNQTMPKRETFT